MRVLLADDDSDAIRLMGDVLSADAHVFDVCSDGDGVSTAFTGAPVDLLLLNLDLQGCDPLDVCHAVRARDTSEHRTAIVVLTGRHDLVARMLAFSVGADDWLEKPLELQQLRTRLDRWGVPTTLATDVIHKRRQAMRDVLRAMCHELNNPLGAAVMGVDLALRRGDLPSETSRDLGVVRDNLDRISGILGAIQTVKDRSYVA